MQIATIEFARNVAHVANATSEEFDGAAQNMVISLLGDRRDVQNKGATMRLGLYDCAIAGGTLAARAYGSCTVAERHRHRYEFNSQFTDILTAHGLVLSGRNPQSGLVEIVEISNHRWFLAVQFHPEFLSKPMAPHPLFVGFVAAAMEWKIARQ
jgi:CTP synthase